MVYVTNRPNITMRLRPRKLLFRHLLFPFYLEQTTLKNVLKNNPLKLERVMGIEPTQPAWKAGTLPLSYTRNSGGGSRI